MLLVDPVAAVVSCETSYTYKYARECNTDIWYRYNLIRDGSSVSPQFPSATRMSDIWHHAHRHEQWKRAASLVAFVKDLKLALALKIRPDQSQAFEEVNNSQAFTVGKKK